MKPIPKSGYSYPNKLGLVALNALEDVLGVNGLNAVLNTANLSNLIQNYPPDNLERTFDYADLSSINQALVEIYGHNGSRGLAFRAGRATFTNGMSHLGALAGMENPEFRSLPLKVRLVIGMPALTKVISWVTGLECPYQELETEFYIRIKQCPVCWGRSEMESPVCYLFTGFFIESLKEISGGRVFNVRETECIAVGDENCEFVIKKTPIS